MTPENVLSSLYGDYTLPMAGRTFAASSENPTAEKGGGSRGGDAEKVHPSTVIKPGETLALLDIDGPGTVNHIWLTGSITPQLILRVYYDGEDEPSVESPLGAFFGYAYGGVRDIDGRFPAMNSALMAIHPGRGLSCFFRMPFRRHCRITVENRSKRDDRRLYYTVTGLLAPVPENAMYFHAGYRQSLPVTAGRAHIVIDGVEGEGRFMGVTLGAGINAPNGCWVEGEVMMFVDGDRYPSINYTGTEDYFCGAYAFGYDTELGRYQSYSGLFCGMHAIMGGAFGDKSEGTYNVQPRFMGYRWHLPDPILFHENFRMKLLNMGFLNHESYARRDDLVTVAYWYQTHPCRKQPPIPADGAVQLY